MLRVETGRWRKECVVAVRVFKMNIMSLDAFGGENFRVLVKTLSDSEGVL